MTNNTAFIGLDTHKETIAVAIAEDGRDGEVRYYGQIANEPAAVLKLVKKLAGKYGKLFFCYEAGPCGYGLQRQIAGLGHDCVVIAPSHTPTKKGVRIKNDRRDALELARLHRAGDLTPIWVRMKPMKRSATWCVHASPRWKWSRNTASISRRSCSGTDASIRARPLDQDSHPVDS